MAAELVLQRERAEERQQSLRLSQRPRVGSIGVFRPSGAPSRISRLGSLFSVRRSSGGLKAAQHSSFESIDE